MLTRDPEPQGFGPVAYLSTQRVNTSTPAASLSQMEDAMKTHRTWAGFLLAIGVISQIAFADGPPPTPEPPAGITSKGTIASSEEVGRRLRVSGQVFAPDGTTPVADVIVYAYQTDASGHYQSDPRRALHVCTDGPKPTQLAALNLPLSVRGPIRVTRLQPTFIFICGEPGILCSGPRTCSFRMIPF